MSEQSLVVSDNNSFEARALAVQGGLNAFDNSLLAAKAVADKLIATSFVPASWSRGKVTPADLAVTIVKGAALGMDPITAANSLYAINGKPAMYAETMAALVKNAGYDIWADEATDEAVTVCVRRRNSEIVHSSTWTIERARKAGYMSNKRYETNPQQMLYARALSEACKRGAPEVLAGLSSVEEESIAVGEAEVKPMQRKRKPGKVKPNDVPEADAAPVVGGVVYEEAEIIEEESEETK